MTPQTLLGPRLKRYRTSLSPLAVLGWPALGPVVILVSALVSGLTGTAEVLFIGLGGLVVLAVSVGYLLWSGSARLDLHEHGVAVGRGFLGGTPRTMRYEEIDPSTIRVFAGADCLLPIWQARFRRSSSAYLFLAPRADRAVTFLGPDRDSALSGAPRPTAAGRGIVVYGSPQAEEIAQQLRAGLERAGCPPRLSRWSAGFGIQRLPRNGYAAAQVVPGMLAARAGHARR